MYDLLNSTPKHSVYPFVAYILLRSYVSPCLSDLPFVTATHHLFLGLAVL